MAQSFGLHVIVFENLDIPLIACASTQEPSSEAVPSLSPT